MAWGPPGLRPTVYISFHEEPADRRERQTAMADACLLLFGELSECPAEWWTEEHRVVAEIALS
jgi:hypothetical protein